MHLDAARMTEHQASSAVLTSRMDLHGGQVTCDTRNSVTCSSHKCDAKIQSLVAVQPLKNKKKWWVGGTSWCLGTSTPLGFLGGWDKGLGDLGLGGFGARDHEHRHRLTPLKFLMATSNNRAVQTLAATTDTQWSRHKRHKSRPLQATASPMFTLRKTPFTTHVSIGSIQKITKIDNVSMVGWRVFTLCRCSPHARCGRPQALFCIASLANPSTMLSITLPSLFPHPTKRNCISSTDPSCPWLLVVNLNEKLQ